MVPSLYRAPLALQFPTASLNILWIPSRGELAWPFASGPVGMIFNTGNHTSAIPVELGLGRVIQLDAGYTLNAYAEVQPSL